ncbi:MAG: hypothetical protein MSQ05_06200 [Akkermansia sp.]|nr:hypothetical protein [Akkermansia sp.]
MEQLIYTSAPRLLDAGKSGFGTIARGRDIPRALVNYLERISTFDRAAGVDSLLYYTVFSAAGLRFHIFSRVQDCGADYTGRTNHVAHHFIAEEGSAEYAALSAGTPAGTMLALQAQWCKRWDEAPRWLEPTPLPTTLPKGEKFAWTRMTDNQENAGWLCAEEYHQGATLVFDCEISAEQALGLLHDAYLRRPDHGWGIGFCTAKVTNINSSSTPYICLDARQAEAGISPGAGSRRLSVRAPMAPPPPSVFRAPEKESIPEQESPPPAPGGIVVEEIEGEDPAPTIHSAPPTNPPVRSPFGAPAQPEPRPFVPGRPTKKRTASTSNKAISVFALLLIGVVALFWKISSDKKQTLQMAEEYAAQVEAAVDLYKEAECPLAKKEFEKVSPEALKKAVEQKEAALSEKHRIELEACWTRFIDALVREGNQKVQELKKHNLFHFEEDMKKAADSVSAAKKDIRLCKDKLAEYCKKLRQADWAAEMLDKLKSLPDGPGGKEKAQTAIQNKWQGLNKGKQPGEFADFVVQLQQTLKEKLQGFIPFQPEYDKLDKLDKLDQSYKKEIEGDINKNNLKEAWDKIEESRKRWEAKKKELIDKAKPHEAKQEVKSLVDTLSKCNYVNADAYINLEVKLSELQTPPPPVNSPTPDSDASQSDASREPAAPPDKTAPAVPGLPGQSAAEDQAKPANVSFKAESITVWVWTNVEGVKVPHMEEEADAESIRTKLAALGDKIDRTKKVFLTATFPRCGFMKFLCDQKPGKVNGKEISRVNIVGEGDLNTSIVLKNSIVLDKSIDLNISIPTYEGKKGWEIDYTELDQHIAKYANIEITSTECKYQILDVTIEWKKPQFDSNKVKKKEGELEDAKNRANTNLEKKRRKAQEEAAKAGQVAQPGAPQGASNERNKDQKPNPKKTKRK